MAAAAVHLRSLDAGRSFGTVADYLESPVEGVRATFGTRPATRFAFCVAETDATVSLAAMRLSDTWLATLLHALAAEPLAARRKLHIHVFALRLEENENEPPTPSSSSSSSSSSFSPPPPPGVRHVHIAYHLDPLWWVGSSSSSSSSSSILSGLRTLHRRHAECWARQTPLAARLDAQVTLRGAHRDLAACPRLWALFGHVLLAPLTEADLGQFPCFQFPDLVLRTTTVGSDRGLDALATQRFRAEAAEPVLYVPDSERSLCRCMRRKRKTAL